MSLLKTIKAQLGLSNTAANNFTLDASADNGTMKLARGNAGATTQDILTVDAAGLVSFSQGVTNIPTSAYITTPSSLTGGVVQNIAHGLGAVPRRLVPSLLVTTAVAGWSVGDIIAGVGIAVGGVANQSIVVGADSTNIVVSPINSNFVVAHKTSATGVSVAPTNFKVLVEVAL